jgi:pullulanase
MIAIRRAHKGFRLGSAEAVREHVEFVPTDNDQLILYRIKDLEGIDIAKSLFVALNGSAKTVTCDLPPMDGECIVLASDGQANADGLDFGSYQQIRVAPYSATIIAEY